MDNLTTTPAQENYIETIYRMSATEKVKPSLLADRLGVRRASVTRLVKTLVNKGLVHHRSHGSIVLTPLGEQLGKGIVRRDACLTRLLVHVCGMPPERADPEVHRLEHAVGDEVLVRLEALVNFACSAEQWCNEVKKQAEEAWAKHPSPSPGPLGRAPIHQGRAHEKHA